MDKDCYLIFEQYRQVATNLILENVEKAIAIKNKYFPNLIYKNDEQTGQFRIDDEIVKKIYNALAEQQVAKTVYLNWIFLMMKNKIPRILEDLESIAKNLKIFNANTSKIAADGYPIQLFNQQTQELVYENPPYLNAVVGNYIPVDEKGERLLLKKGQYLVSKKEAEEIYEDDNFVVYSPKTYNASKELGCLSQWCTRFPDMYKRYSSQGPLYIVFDKFKLGENLFGKALDGDENNSNRMIQIHFPSKQFKDIKNHQVGNRPEFMNRIKGLYDTLFPNAMKELQEVVFGKKQKSDLSPETKASFFIMPQEYRDELNMPCDEIQEKIAFELKVDCREVIESEYGYEVNGKEYRIETVEDALDQAVETFKDGGLDDEWFMNNIFDGVYSWEDVHKKEDYEQYPVTTGKEAFSIDDPETFEEIYRVTFEPRRIDELQDKDYSEEDIRSGKYFNDLPYEKFIKTLQDSYGSDPVRYYVENLGYNIELWFIDFDRDIRNWFDSSPYYEDRLGPEVSSYDGMVYYFDIDDKEMIMYRVE